MVADALVPPLFFKVALVASVLCAGWLAENYCLLSAIMAFCEFLLFSAPTIDWG
jgi:hypothetical protein